MKVVEDELLDNSIEGSGIFLICADYDKFCLEGLRQKTEKRLDEIHLEIWFTTEWSCAIEVETEAG